MRKNIVISDRCSQSLTFLDMPKTTIGLWKRTKATSNIKN